MTTEQKYSLTDILAHRIDHEQYLRAGLFALVHGIPKEIVQETATQVFSSVVTQDLTKGSRIADKYDLSTKQREPAATTAFANALAKKEDKTACEIRKTHQIPFEAIAESLAVRIVGELQSSEYKNSIDAAIDLATTYTHPTLASLPGIVTSATDAFTRCMDDGDYDRGLRVSQVFNVPSAEALAAVERAYARELVKEDTGCAIDLATTYGLDKVKELTARRLRLERRSASKLKSDIEGLLGDVICNSANQPKTDEPHLVLNYFLDVRCSRSEGYLNMYERWNLPNHWSIPVDLSWEYSENQRTARSTRAVPIAQLEAASGKTIDEIQPEIYRHGTLFDLERQRTCCSDAKVELSVYSRVEDPNQKK